MIAKNHRTHLWAGFISRVSDAIAATGRLLRVAYEITKILLVRPSKALELKGILITQLIYTKEFVGSIGVNIMFRIHGGPTSFQGLLDRIRVTEIPRACLNTGQF